MVRLQIDAGAPSHDVYDDLNKSLLLKCVTNVLVALEILESEFKFGLLEFLFANDDLLHEIESVDTREHITQVSVRKWLQLVDVVGHDHQ